ncbi:hypothetical protein ACFOZ7_14800 [Natribaculum luteum]|uniref:Uncharacterized protein n=1 Tax=Natribaculum luteum TaxID=1586232 RepID=A0ABD5P276_9EURY|nr:hypothetical protein [Natribaculum luteum]
MSDVPWIVRAFVSLLVVLFGGTVGVLVAGPLGGVGGAIVSGLGWAWARRRDARATRIEALERRVDELETRNDGDDSRS